jgi:hypothetical protein
MLLDFFATFFSSATALLPIFATQILNVGPLGYGWLASAQSVGAVSAPLVLSSVRQLHRQGRLLLTSGDGLRPVDYSVRAVPHLLADLRGAGSAGASDSVSTIIRNTIRQLQTPDHLRGRMVSVNQIFFTGGQQLGEMEAGLVAQVLGAPLSVISGGIGCLLAVAWVARRWPELRHYVGEETAPV